MATSPMSRIVRQLRRAALVPEEGAVSDGRLLESFVSRRDEAAFEALVRRHGPMVWGVCQRILHNHHDAEDAFQATFLVLVRKARSVVPRERVAGWLYGVARYAALKVQTAAARRRDKEREVAERAAGGVTGPDPWPDLEPWLDQELARLPEKYRLPVILCDLEGKTHKEAALQLGWPPGTVSGRLARARAMLAKRLARRGVALSAVSLAALLSEQSASAAVPGSVVISAVQAANLASAGQAAAPAAVAAVVEGVLKAMLVSKLRLPVLVVLVAVAVGSGAVLVGHPTRAGEQDAAPRKQLAPLVRSGQEGEPDASSARPVAAGRTRIAQAGFPFVLTDVKPADRVVWLRTEQDVGPKGEKYSFRYDVAPEARITIGGKKARLADLRPGMAINFATQRRPGHENGPGVITRIDALGDQHESKARRSAYTYVLQDVDATDRRITVLVKGAGKYGEDMERINSFIKFDLAPNVRVVIAGKDAALDDLVRGMAVRLIIDRENPREGTIGTVYKVEAAGTGTASRPAPEAGGINIEDATLEAVDAGLRRISVRIGPKPVLGGKVRGPNGEPVEGQPRKPIRMLDLPVAGNADITISSLGLPSVANHVQRRLGELQVGMTVSLSLTGDHWPVVTKIVGWRSP